MNLEILAWYVGKWIEKVFDKTCNDTYLQANILRSPSMTKDNQYLVCCTKPYNNYDAGFVYKINESDLEAVTNNYYSDSYNYVEYVPFQLKIDSSKNLQYTSWGLNRNYYGRETFDCLSKCYNWNSGGLARTQVSAFYKQDPNEYLYSENSQIFQIGTQYNYDYGYYINTFLWRSGGSGATANSVLVKDSIDIQASLFYFLSLSDITYAILYNQTLGVLSRDGLVLNAISYYSIPNIGGINHFPLSCISWKNKETNEARILYQVDDGGSDNLTLNLIYWPNAKTNITNFTDESDSISSIASIIDRQEIRQFFANNTFTKIILTTFNQQEEDYGMNIPVDNIYYFLKRNDDWIQINKYQSIIDPYLVVEETKKEVTTFQKLQILSFEDFNLLTMTQFVSNHKFLIKSFDLVWND